MSRFEPSRRKLVPSSACRLAAIAALALLTADAARAGVQVTLAPGIPNISGTWERYRGRPGDPALPPREAQAPMKPDVLRAWQARQAERRAADARGQPLATRNAYCIPDGMPGMMAGPFPFEILQSPGQVTIVQEAYNQIRRIYLDKPQSSLADLELGFYGHSVGQWDDKGNLSADTIGVKEDVRFRDVPHSPNMRITERIHLAAPDILWDEVTVVDPAVLTGPWTFTFAYKRMQDYEILEDVCEDNREYSDENGVLQLGPGGQAGSAGGAAPAGGQGAGETSNGGR
jgi:hypothetical protein